MMPLDVRGKARWVTKRVWKVLLVVKSLWRIAGGSLAVSSSCIGVGVHGIGLVLGSVLKCGAKPRAISDDSVTYQT